MADGGEDGSVQVGSVIAALRAAGVSVSEISDHEFVIVKEGIPHAYVLNCPVPRKMLHYLSRRYGVRIEWFYHPEMYCGGAQGVQ